MGMSDAQDLAPAMRAPEGSSLARRARSLPACPFESRDTQTSVAPMNTISRSASGAQPPPSVSWPASASRPTELRLWVMARNSRSIRKSQRRHGPATGATSSG